MPLHWIYSEKDIREIVDEGDPAFHSPPATKYYKKLLGEGSVYADELQPLIEALLLDDGGLNDFVPPNLAKSIFGL